MTNDTLHVGFALQNPGMDFKEPKAPQLQMMHILRGLERAGHRLTLLMLRHGRKVLCTSDLDELRFGKLGASGTASFMLVESAVRRVQTISGLPYLGLFDSYRFMEACCRNLSSCDLWHERNTLFSIGVALAARRMRKPYVLSIDADELLEMNYVGQPLRGLRLRVARVMARFTYQSARAITCVSPAAKRHFVDNWGISESKIRVISNGVDVQSFRVMTNGGSSLPALDTSNRQVIMFVGGFWPWHGLDLLIDSFRAVLIQIPDASLVLIGDGPTRQALQQRVAEYGIDKAVCFTGPVEHTQIPTLLARADVCVAPYPQFTSEFWMSPMKLYEYMAAGKAIVASGVGMIPTVIRDGVTGRLVKPGDAGALANALIDVLQNPSLQKQLGENAYQQAIHKHSWDHYVEQLQDVYLGAL